MKYKLFYIASLFLSCLLLGCDDKTEDFNGPYSLVVVGSTVVAPETSQTYRLAPYANPETYKWTIEGPGTIVGATTGLAVKVAFSAVGKVKLSVTNGTDKALYPITVADVTPDAEVVLNGTGVLKTGAKDTIFLVYPSPLKTLPTITMLTADDSSYFHKKDKVKAFESGTLGPLTKLPGDDVTYYAIYSPSAGNGTGEALVQGAVSTDEFGADTVDSLYLELYRVDNIAPLANISYSTLLANEGTEVTVTATFSEPVMFISPTDSALHVKFTGAGVSDETDTLFATENPLVYTYTYTVTGTGNGTLGVSLSNITDLAGNDLTAAATTETGGKVVIDNTPPVTTGLATDGGTFASIKITSTETGTGSYLILDLDAKDPVPPPTTVNAYINTAGVASGIVNLQAGVQNTIVQVLPDSHYMVYFLTQDQAGNTSAITSVPLTMN